MVRPMVHSEKHYVQTSIAPILSGAKLDTVVISAVAVPTLVEDVKEGSSIKAIYLEYWVRSSELSPGSGIFVVYKNPGGSVLFSVAQLAGLGTAENKKNVFYVTQGLYNDNDADAIAVFRGWLKIPKSKQRFGLGDRLVVAFFAQGAIDINICGFATYKEYS